MKTIKTLLVTEAIFSDDGKKRYLIKKVWDEKKPKLAVIMLAPSEASGIELDNSTQLVINNAVRLGFGSIEVLNLFATLNDFSLKYAEDEDVENMNVIIKSAKAVDTIVYAAGVGKVKNKIFQERQRQVLTKLLPFEKKLNCLCNKKGAAKFQHPLSPAVRIWHLSPFKMGDLINATHISVSRQKNKIKE